MTDKHAHAWWGEYEVDRDEWARWQIGPLTLWARPSSGEWRLAWATDTDITSTTVSTSIPAGAEPDPEAFEFARIAVGAVGNTLRLAPRTADLSVVVRPETMLFIPPSEKTVLYVGTTVWISIQSAGKGETELMRLPVFRPSDTWFGDNTRIGELCYATTTKARTRLNLLHPVPHRAITPVELVNDGADTLHVEQLRIPVTALSLHESEGQLWTDGIRYTRSMGRSAAEVDILQASEHLPQSRTKLAGPIEPLKDKSIIQAFSALFR